MMSRITPMNKLCILLYAIFANTFCEANSKGLQLSNRIIINVKSFGVRADGTTDDSQAFNAAWKKACNTQGNVTFLIPKGTYLVGPLQFQGPCQQVSSLTILMKGYLKATTDLSRYEFESGWIEFKWIDGLNLRGGGVFDGRGNLKFVGMNRTIIDSVTSLNSKFFHIALVECRDFNGSRIKINAPEDSPNTDGIHVERSYNVRLSNSNIGTGDDCISIGQGNSQITITNITCGPGKYPHEQDINGLYVTNCTISGTSNGVRIKTWANSPGRSAATNMRFENILMKHTPSRVRLSNIYFKNIRGTSLSEVAVTLSCSKGIPCKNIFLQNVHLNLTSGERLPLSSCENVKARYIGVQMPPPCP
ncbi:Exopolygalacturonase [Bienertia sinuspersici]